MKKTLVTLLVLSALLVPTLVVQSSLVGAPAQPSVVDNPEPV